MENKPDAAATQIVVLPASELKALVRGAVREEMKSSVVPLVVDRQTMAQQLGCSATHLDELRKKGLPSVKVGERTYRFEPQAVLDWLRRHGDEPE